MSSKTFLSYIMVISFDLGIYSSVIFSQDQVETLSSLAVRGRTQLMSRLLANPGDGRLVAGHTAGRDCWTHDVLLNHNILFCLLFMYFCLYFVFILYVDVRILCTIVYIFNYVKNLKLDRFFLC